MEFIGYFSFFAWESFQCLRSICISLWVPPPAPALVNDICLYPLPPLLLGSWSFSFFFLNNRAFFFSLSHTTLACGILIPWPGIKPLFPAGEASILNHWTAREVPRRALYMLRIFPTIMTLSYVFYLEPYPPPCCIQKYHSFFTAQVKPTLPRGHAWLYQYSLINSSSFISYPVLCFMFIGYFWLPSWDVECFLRQGFKEIRVLG